MNRNKERETLEAWLLESGWARRQREESQETDERPLAAAPLKGPAAAAGQIRLWPAARADDEPFYALVMPSDYGCWLLIPFSPYATPATPAEHRLRPSPPAQVLQFWNRRRVPRARVEASWCAETIPENEQTRVRDSLLRHEAGAPPEAEWCGAPLLHPLDPRHAYLDGEAERVTRALGEVFALGEADETALRLAAEPRKDNPYG